jgi:hypothetical protein
VVTVTKEPEAQARLVTAASPAGIVPASTMDPREYSEIFIVVENGGLWPVTKVLCAPTVDFGETRWACAPACWRKIDRRSQVEIRLTFPTTGAMFTGLWLEFVDVHGTKWARSGTAHPVPQ